MEHDKKVIKIVAISDTHDKHKFLQPADFPQADIFIHAGDFTRMSRKKQYDKFYQFLQALPYKHKIVVPGNHDWALQGNLQRCKKLNEAFKVRAKQEVDPQTQINKLKGMCTFLNHQAIEIEGLKIFGSPYVISNKDMGFSYKEVEGQKIWTNMPQKIDILVTHGPPYGIRDVSIHSQQSCGCKVLLQRVKAIKPKVHIFGHIHEGNGHVKIDQTDFYNVAYMDQKYHPKNKPVLIEVQVQQKQNMKMSENKT